jgi:ribose transport system ATP-binding protein
MSEEAVNREGDRSHYPLVSIRNLSKSFPGVRALDNCQFELRSGEVHALMGENGAGKSTLMKVLAGVYQKDEGDILVDGKPVDIPDPRSAQALGIGIVHQELNLMNHLSAAQNIFIGREPRGRLGVFIDERELNRKATEIFERMRLKLDPRTLVGDLTVAKQQMVEIAKALSFHSRVLIMDEPTAALNDAEIEDLFRIIRQLKSEGVGIVYISHKMDELKRISDRVTVMRDGQYVATVPAAETPVETIISMMVGRQLDTAPRHPSHAADMAANAVALEVKGVTRGTILKDASFKLHRGEILGFAGLMGAGRTELARAIFGADPRDRGEIYVHGRKVSITSPKDAVRHGIGYLSEDRKQFGLATGMDVKANVALSSMNEFTSLRLFLDQRAIQQAAERFVSQLRIKTPSIHQQVRLLSGGNQQKVVIAKWLLRDCDILFFDEPTRGIDVGAKSEIYKLIDALAAEGKAIVMISSELPEILRMSHRVLVMCEGRITGELAAGEATQEKIMHFATLRESLVTE